MELKSLTVVAMSLAGLLSPAALADEPEADCAYAVTQSDLNICTFQAFQAADAELNRVYAEAMAAMRDLDKGLKDFDLEGAAEALTNAQRAWIPFRDKACEAQGFLARGGSMEPMIVNGCMTTLTKQRIEDLKSLLVGFEN